MTIQEEVIELSKDFERRMKLLEYVGPKWWELNHEYPSEWECPKCGVRLHKCDLAWNFLLEENICYRCGNPQRQFAMPPIIQ